ncbi:hypothetical protein MTCOM_18050 [Moorella thermoacetica]|uniref:hypothetical protein n=1 Tax=Neomoorella thermoacetica TaxID=1525 RepID=UPI0030CC082E
MGNIVTLVKKDNAGKFDWAPLYEAYVSGANGDPLNERDDGWMDGCCPLHDDTRPSFSFNRWSGYWLCRAGCGAGWPLDFLEAVAGLDGDDALEEIRELCGSLPPEIIPGPLTLTAYAVYCNLPVSFLQKLGLAECAKGVKIPYCTVDGQVFRYRYRLSLNKQGSRFAWGSGKGILPYGLENLHLAKKAGYLLLVEGESDVQTLLYAGIPALGSPGVAAWQKEWSALIPEGVQIYIWQEPDEGHVLVEKVLRAFPDAKIIKTTVEEKDPRQVWLNSRDKADFVQRINELLQTATTADDLQEAARRTEREAVWQKCKDLAMEPDILTPVLNTLSQVVAGEREALAILYLALTSRLLPRPINLLLQAPPGAGKSYLVDCVLQMFPESAYYKLTASSERAFIYSDENFAHRTVVVAEAAGLHSDGVAGTIIRELVWSSQLAYEVVEKTPDGLRPRKIIKDGPVGLITTTVKNVEGELATRLLVVELKDTPEQTRLILEAEAREAAGQATMPDLSHFAALQKWLELNGPANVIVPYAETLARLLKPSSVRLRRDFRQLLTLIMANAVLHRASRQTSSSGAIIASIDDYAAIYPLAVALFASTGEATLTPQQREAVEAVRRYYEQYHTSVTVKALSKLLGIDRTSTQRRVAAAIKKGFLVNLEDKPHRPAMLVPGDMAAEEDNSLPEPEMVARMSS